MASEALTGDATTPPQDLPAGTITIDSTTSYDTLINDAYGTEDLYFFLPNVPYGQGETYSFPPNPADPTGSGGVFDSNKPTTLTLLSSTGQTLFTFTNVDAHGTSYFGPGTPYNTGNVPISITPQGNGTLVHFLTVTNTYCYVADTRILLDTGERTIKTLQVGDVVVTQSGERRPIKWIGRRSFTGRFLAGNIRVLPIRFRAGCLGDGLPRRDLFVSPDHAMVLQGQLIAARNLVNGDTILQEAAVDRVDYFHLELDSHDVIFAEGAASETFVDDGRRAMFQNASDYAVQYPDAPVPSLRYCLPRLHDGDELEAIRHAIAERGRPERPTLRGRIDSASLEFVQGWAWDEVQPDTAVKLRITDNGAVLGTVLADAFRPDLPEAGVGDGRHSFRFAIPGGLRPDLMHELRVERANDGSALPNSPIRIEPMHTTAVGPAQSAPLRGNVDGAAFDRIWGWAWSPAAAHETVRLQMLDNGVLLAQAAANRHRPDLEAAKIGQGWHGFEISFPGGLERLERHVLRIVRESDGAELTGSPVIIEPSGAFDARLEQAVAGAVTTSRGRQDQGRALAFLTAQAERIRQHQAELEVDRPSRINAQRQSEWVGAGKDSQSNLRALIVTSRFEGGDGPIISIIEELQRGGHEVSLVVADALLPSAVSDRLAEVSVSWCGSPFYGSVEEVLRRQKGCFDAVVLCEADSARHYASLVEHYQPTARIIHGVAVLQRSQRRTQRRTGSYDRQAPTAETHRRAV